MPFDLFTALGLFSLVSLLVNVVIPIAIIVVLVRILGRLDAIERRLNGSLGAARPAPLDRRLRGGSDAFTH